MREKKNMLQVILQSKIEQFIINFLNNSKDIYFDDNGELIHPGEFGTYREKICMDLLRNIIPMRLDFGSGFIIDEIGNVSHQCDIIIFDSKNTPLIENNERQRFFPIESVVGVGEVKSDLSKQKFKESLQKLSNVKKMRLNIDKRNPMVFEANNNTRRDYQPDLNPRDQLFTFLICDSLLFECDGIVDEFDVIYDGIDVKLRHNMILSVRNGTFMYYDNVKKIHYPYINNSIFSNCLVKPSELPEEEDFTYKYSHIFSFLNYLYQGIACGTILYPDLTHYIVKGLHSNFIYEKNINIEN